MRVYKREKKKSSEKKKNSEKHVHFLLICAKMEGRNEREGSKVTENMTVFGCPVRTVTPAGTFRGAETLTAEVVSLGFSAVCLTAFGNGAGTVADLKRLCRILHAEGLRVYADMSCLCGDGESPAEPMRQSTDVFGLDGFFLRAADFSFSDTYATLTALSAGRENFRWFVTDGRRPLPETEPGKKVRIPADGGTFAGVRTDAVFTADDPAAALAAEVATLAPVRGDGLCTLFPSANAAADDARAALAFTLPGTVFTDAAFLFGRPGDMSFAASAAGRRRRALFCALQNLRCTPALRHDVRAGIGHLLVISERQEGGTRYTAVNAGPSPVKVTDKNILSAPPDFGGGFDRVGESVFLGAYAAVSVFRPTPPRAERPVQTAQPTEKMTENPVEIQ